MSLDKVFPSFIIENEVTVKVRSGFENNIKCDELSSRRQFIAATNYNSHWNRFVTHLFFEYKTDMPYWIQE